MATRMLMRPPAQIRALAMSIDAPYGQWNVRAFVLVEATAEETTSAEALDEVPLTVQAALGWRAPELRLFVDQLRMLANATGMRFYSMGPDRVWQRHTFPSVHKLTVEAVTGTLPELVITGTARRSGRAPLYDMTTLPRPEEFLP